jgi:hypothetical protein
MSFESAIVAAFERADSNLGHGNRLPWLMSASAGKAKTSSYRKCHPETIHIPRRNFSLQL